MTARVQPRVRKAQPAITIIDAIDDPALFAPWFKRRQSWAAWRVFLKAMFALPLSAAELAIYQQCTGRTHAPTEPFYEAWLVCGRRAGKSFMLALIAVFLACFHDWRQYLAPGERGTIMIIASDRKQSRVIFRYIRAMLTGVPMLARLIERETQEAFDLSNSISIEVQTASFRSVRGYAIVAALLDEVAFWPTDDAAEPDHEIIAALRPAQATIPGAMLLCASSPYARRGTLWDAHRRHYGKNGDPILVWQADTRTMNRTVPQSFIDAAYESDPASAAAEYGAQFRTDVENFVSREVVEALVVTGRYELSPANGVHYAAFVDPSGGSSDSMTLAIGHKQNDVAILDAVREIKPPFSPEGCVSEFATLLKNYGITIITGDRFAGEWPVEQFAKFGIRYDQSAKPKSDLYRDLLPVLNSGRVELLDHPRLVAQLCSLERRTARGGRDSIDHAPGGHDDVANSVAGVVCSLVAGNAADGWIAWAASEAERASEMPDDAEDDPHSTRQTPFYLPGNTHASQPPPPSNVEQQPNKDNAARHPWMPAALENNSYSAAYFSALSRAEGRVNSLQTPKCSSCGNPTNNSRVTDGVRSWCHEGHRQQWARELAEKNKARAIAENGGLAPTSQPVKQTKEGELA